MRTSLGLTDEKVILHAGRLTEVKNQKFLIRLMRQIADQKMNVKLLIVGDGELRAELEDLITRLELNNFVMLLGSRSDINHFYQASDIFVLPGLNEEIDKINFSIDQRKYIGNLVIQNHFDISDVAKDFKSILGISADI